MLGVLLHLSPSRSKYYTGSILGDSDCGAQASATRDKALPGQPCEQKRRQFHPVEVGRHRTNMAVKYWLQAFKDVCSLALSSVAGAVGLPCFGRCMVLRVHVLCSVQALRTSVECGMNYSLRRSPTKGSAEAQRRGLLGGPGPWASCK